MRAGIHKEDPQDAASVSARRHALPAKMTGRVDQKKDSIMSYRSRCSRFARLRSGTLRCTAFVCFSGLAPGYAGELPKDIWNGGHGGFPSMTANQSGVSVTLPEQAVAAAGGGSLASLVKGFLDRWAPQFCTDLFDFQHPHEKMTLRVAVHSAGGGPAQYQEVVVDYKPSQAVECVQPENLVF